MRGRVHYGWVIAAVTLLTLVMTAGFRSTSSLLIVPLQNEFGWSRATISIALSINLLLYGLGGPFAAGFIERFGLRRVMVGALLVVSGGYTTSVFVEAPWQLDLLIGIVVGLGTGAISVTLAAIVANRWFVARRGLVMGMLTAANATGQLIFLPLLGWIVTSYGWRPAALAVAGTAVLFVLPLVAIFMRDRPEAVGLRPFGADASYVPDHGRSGGRPFAEAFAGLGRGFRSRTFWLLSGSFFVCGATTNGLIGTHLIPASMDHGMTEVAAASLLAAIGVFDLIGTTGSGWLTDRYNPKTLLVWYYGLRGLSLLALPYAFGSPHVTLILFVVFYGLDWVATVPPTVALTTDAFGRRHVGVVFGWIFAAHQIGAAFAAWGAGAIRTWTGTYTSAFVTAGILCFVACGLVRSIRDPEDGETAASRRPIFRRRRLTPAPSVLVRLAPVPLVVFAVLTLRVAQPSAAPARGPAPAPISALYCLLE